MGSTLLAIAYLIVAVQNKRRYLIQPLNNSDTGVAAWLTKKK
jgi:hypothetical protein